MSVVILISLVLIPMNTSKLVNALAEKKKYGHAYVAQRNRSHIVVVVGQITHSVRPMQRGNKQHALTRSGPLYIPFYVHSHSAV